MTNSMPSATPGGRESLMRSATSREHTDVTNIGDLVIGDIVLLAMGKMLTHQMYFGQVISLEAPEVTANSDNPQSPLEPLTLCHLPIIIGSDAMWSGDINRIEDLLRELEPNLLHGHTVAVSSLGRHSLTFMSDGSSFPVFCNVPMQA